MQDTLETLQHQLDDLESKMVTIEQFEKLFNSEDIQEFRSNYGHKDAEGTFLHHIMQPDIKNTFDVFGKLNFAEGDARAVYVGEAIELLSELVDQNNSTNTNNLSILEKPGAKRRAYAFFQLAIHAFFESEKPSNVDVFSSMAGMISSLSMTPTKAKPDPIKTLTEKVQKLIALQKKELHATIQNIKKKIEAQQIIPRTENKQPEITDGPSTVAIKIQKMDDPIAEEKRKAEPMQPRKKYAYYIGSTMLVTTGAALTTFSALKQFGPQFAFLASLHLPPIALAAIAATGIIMLFAGAYLAYQTDNLNPTPKKLDTLVTLPASCLRNAYKNVSYCFGLFGFGAETTPPGTDPSLNSAARANTRLRLI